MQINKPFLYGAKLQGLPDNFAQLMIRGDISCMFSHNETEWHFDRRDNGADADEYVRYSFDGGENWPLKFKFRNVLTTEKNYVVNQNDSSSLQDLVLQERGTEYEFEFDPTYSATQWEAIANATPMFFAVNAAGDLTSIASFRVSYNATGKKIKMKILENLPSDTMSIKMKLIFNGGDAIALSLPTNEFNTETP